MNGEKIETAKRSCIDIFRRLDQHDLLTVVTFADDVAVVINPQTPRGEVEARLSALAANGMTNLSLGWYQGLLELQTHMDESHYSRLFLLSDGMANRGETKRAVFADTATRAREVGISASTIGIGESFQEDILEAIASSSGGRFWNITDSDIEDIIDEEFRGARTVVFDRPRVELILPPGVKVSRELNALRKAAQRYRLRPLQGEDTFNFAVRLEIDPSQASDDNLVIGATLYDGDREIISSDVNLTLGTRQQVAASGTHPLVRSTVQQYETSASDEAILGELDAGNVEEMRRMLTAEIAKLRRLERGLRDMDNPRARYELDHLLHNIGNKQIAGYAMELCEPYMGDGEVRRFLGHFRKSKKHEDHRLANRRLDVTPWEDEARLVLEALGLADRLIEQHPDDATRLHEIRERLREYLESR